MDKKYDENKPMWDLIPLGLVEQIVKVLDYGLKKYGERDSWMDVENAESRYFSAMMRHLTKYQSGESIDPESNLSHLSHAACNIIFLMWFEK